jgi:hypothetical protein
MGKIKDIKEGKKRLKIKRKLKKYLMKRANTSVN